MQYSLIDQKISISWNSSICQNPYESAWFKTLQISSIPTMFEIGFEKHTHTLSVHFRTSQRLYFVSRRADKRPYSLVFQLILVKSAPSLFLFVLWMRLHLSSPQWKEKWARLHLYPNVTDTPEWQFNWDLSSSVYSGPFSKDISSPLMLFQAEATKQV